MNNLMTLTHKDNIFIAKGNVRHTTGGPTMALVGFIHPIAEKIFEEVDENLSAYQITHLSEKICIVPGKGIGFYPGVNSAIFYGHIWNRDGKLGGWHSENGYASKFNCLVRFYDDTTKKFIFKVFSPLELELVK